MTSGGVAPAVGRNGFSISVMRSSFSGEFG
jgi:hypothetical protein